MGMRICLPKSEKNAKIGLRCRGSRIQPGGKGMQARIHFARINRQEALYIEDLLLDDGSQIITHSHIPPQFHKVWAKDAWVQKGIMAGGEVVSEVRKHHFYQEWFDIIELFDAGGRLIGYYCDVITPLRKVDGEYYLQDLLLDLWIFPDGRTVELDWDEFEEAVHAGQISAEWQQKAVETLQRMVAETRQGIFPGRYLG
jgi:predicted RNA-binding protein associated with RNAse of E/G family